jgi:hypothetical protein
LHASPARCGCSDQPRTVETLGRAALPQRASQPALSGRRQGQRADEAVMGGVTHLPLTGGRVGDPHRARSHLRARLGAAPRVATFRPAAMQDSVRPVKWCSELRRAVGVTLVRLEVAHQPRRMKSSHRRVRW